MRPAYDFGMSQEDERTEAAALGLPGGRVLSIASAGDMALSLAALGADDVTAVDVAESQLHLGRLKLAAALGLGREQAIRFLGLLPAPPRERERWLSALGDHLPAATWDFWRANRAAVRAGPIWAGRYERYLRTVRACLAPVFGRRFEALCECATLEDQREQFDRDIDGPLLRAAFRVAFADRLYRGRAMAPNGLQHRDARQSLGEQFFARFRALCVSSPARDNPWLQLHVLGRVRGPDVVPEYLTERGVAALRSRPSAVTFVHGSILDVLEGSEVGRFDRFHLSNVPDWLALPDFERLLERIVERGARPSRIVWRYLHRRYAIPATCRAAAHLDRAAAGELEAHDRFPLYGIAPAAITG